MLITPVRSFTFARKYFQQNLNHYPYREIVMQSCHKPSLMKKLLILITVSVAWLSSSAQFSIRDSAIAFPMIGATIAYQFPGGDLSDRFGSNFNVGGVFQWKLKNNWVFGVEGNFIFGTNVKEDNILDNLK